tara:strand:+ start:14711 stop:15208 length:498 start_codon:yes stop_codon:yes gene_type:complete
MCTIAYNTNYYRRNKEKRFKVHQCPHCNFETTGPKSCLQAHVWAKHTIEKDRPFQCPCNDCDRGYSARANLHKHMKQCHNIEIPKDKNIFAYVIYPNLNDNIKDNLTNDEVKRLDFYNKNKILSKDMKQYNNIINKEILYHDEAQRIISIKKFTKDDIITMNKKN